MKIKGVTKWWLTTNSVAIQLRTNSKWSEDGCVRYQWRKSYINWIKAYYKLLVKRVQYANASAIYSAHAN